MAALLAVTLAAAGAQARGPGYERYGAAEGLASGEIISIAEDRAGYPRAALGAWSPATSGRVAFFPNLPNGAFVVRVQARHGGAGRARWCRA